jgi:3-phenylpropionate/trans-cinnamate dioxygenase ferredoxin reductase subunit
MTDSPHIVVVGAGLAGVQAAESLRAGGFGGALTLLGAERRDPYHRPPLSKAWLAGEIDAAQLALRAPGSLAGRAIALRTGTRAAAIDRERCALQLDDGTALAYTGLVIATGATPRRLALPGADAPNVFVLRTRDDADALAAAMQRGRESRQPLVVIGGGFIGLEVAATARKKGLAVTVVEAMPRLMARTVAPMIGDWFAALHREHGVDLRLGAQVDAIEVDAKGEACAVRLGDNERIAAGSIVVGVGIEPDDALARLAGLECDRGIVVDACARTADPRIVAAGDCTARRLPDGRLLRLESVHNATEQGRSAAAALLGQSRPFAATPWFWSDQYDRKLQMAGLSAGADRWVLRGRLGAASFSVCHYRGDRLIAVDSVNAARDHLLARKLLDAGSSPTPDQAADPGFDLAQLLPSR